jgi:hypothetical protein
VRAAYEKASNGQFGPATYRLELLEAQAGEFEKAAALFKAAASHPGKQLGFLKEAEKEFDKAVKTSNGSLTEAADNLNLCRSLTAGVISSGSLRLSS